LRPTWGPRQLRASLQRSHPGVELPRVTTLALSFKRNSSSFGVGVGVGFG
jgi:hypothetical protein